MQKLAYVELQNADEPSINKAFTFETEVEKVLDELWEEKLIPFRLHVGKITKEIDGYTIHFHDSRIWTARLPFADEQLFSDVVRQAVLTRVARLTGPFALNYRT